MKTDCTGGYEKAEPRCSSGSHQLCIGSCLFLQVWLVWTDKTNTERQEKGIRQLAQEARQGNAHDENVLTYYR